NEAEMQSMGMKMNAEDIYSVNHGSLKDAIVHFNGGCTSEIISPQGLLLTNHHCGYGQIQSHSTLEHNYLRDGFWAQSLADELPNDNLTATLISRIEDVTKEVLAGVTDKLSPKERQSLIDKNIEKVKAAAKKEAHEEVMIRPFFKGNQYFMFITVTYRDIRLVGTPPESIGKFGSDTDNWVWPRHTGDFSIFRIYAGKDNLPADYSEDNVPFKPKHFLPISLDGIEEGDFTMVFGFPGRTNEYLPSHALEQMVDVLNPAKIAIRDKALKIVDAEMRADEEVRLQYASKFARIANYWKKWIGESQGLKKTDGIGRKKRLEADFVKKINADARFAGYRDLLPRFEKLYKEIEPYALSRDYHNEVMGRNVELMQVAGYAARLVSLYNDNGTDAYEGFKARLLPYLNRFYKNYRLEIDKKVFEALVEMYTLNVPIIELPAVVAGAQRKWMAADYAQLATKLYGGSFLTDKDKMIALLEGDASAAVKAFQEDPLVGFATDLRAAYVQYVSPKLNSLQNQINEAQRQYMKAQMEVFTQKRFYPDANGTLRITYGKVNGYYPRDAVHYTPVTYLAGVMEKYKPGDYEFDVPPRLIELYEKKDYGPYGENGKMPVCFIGTNHTTGGNSGSPAIDAHGNLIGLNFDRAWEGTMSDFNYDPSICRNIMVDIRYVLFIIDKYAGATRLIDEMKLVHPKRKR
ncbi:MAG TPA: S46 family peptidase, partial [Phaeodactylibacter sp.]|nr:S46 family peptidase [Phaeodactylibacter sp.]